MLYNRAEKLRRGYKEAGSIVRQDGSEKLVGRDWKNRKVALWLRCEGHCEWVIGWCNDVPFFCGNEANDPHHIRARSKGRDDRLSNLQALCRYHHILLDKRKIGGRKCT